MLQALNTNTHLKKTFTFSQLSQKIKDENGDGTIVFVDDGNESSLPAAELAAFEEYLPLAEKEVNYIRVLLGKNCI